MAKPDKTIDPRLLSCAEEVFLEYGYEKASTNMICKNAGVTTGALFNRYSTKEALFNAVVGPVAEEFKELLYDQKRSFENLVVDEQEAEVFTYKTFDFVEYVYTHFNVFKLLLECSQGTRYEKYLEELVELFVDSIRDYMEATNRKALINGKTATPEILHILTRAYLAGLFEPVLHNMSKSDAREYTDQITYFFSKGWADIFSIKI